MFFSLSPAAEARISWEESEYAKYVAGQSEKVTEAEQDAYDNWCEMMELDSMQDHWEDFADWEVGQAEDAAEQMMWERGCGR